MILGYQPYRGYVQLNKNPATGLKENIIVWEAYNHYSHYSTYEAAKADITTAYGGVFANSQDRTYKIETVYSADAPATQDPYVPPTITPPEGGSIDQPSEALRNRRLIEVQIGNITFANALSNSGDFRNRVDFLCQKSGYRLVEIARGNPNVGSILIDVERQGSWPIVKLVGAIIAIIGIVLVAIFSGSVVLGGIAVVGGLFALHFIVRDFLNADIIAEGTKIQDDAINNLKSLIDEIRNDPTLTDEQKQQLIQDVYTSINDTLEAIGKDPIPDVPQVGGGDDGGSSGDFFEKTQDILMFALVFFVLIMLFQQMRHKK